MLPLLAAFAAATAWCAEAGTPLADDSPFLPPGGQTGAVQDPNALDFRGYMPTRDGLRYCIYDPVKKKSEWASVNESGHPFLIKSADPRRETVTLEADGRVLTLSLHQARIATMAPAGPGGPVMAGPGGQLPPNISQAQAAQLAAIANAVAERRRLRQEAEANGSANGAGFPQQNGGARRPQRPAQPGQ